MNIIFDPSRIAIPITNIVKIGEILRLIKQKRIPSPTKEWISTLIRRDKWMENRTIADEMHDPANQIRTFEIESERWAGGKYCSSRRQVKQMTPRRHKKVGAEI